MWLSRSHGPLDCFIWHCLVHFALNKQTNNLSLHPNTATHSTTSSPPVHSHTRPPSAILVFRLYDNQQGTGGDRIPAFPPWGSASLDRWSAGSLATVLSQQIVKLRPSGLPASPIACSSGSAEVLQCSSSSVRRTLQCCTCCAGALVHWYTG